MKERLSTGVPVLNRQLGGGIPEGSLIAFVAPAASQSELFLYELTTARNTLYLTADRTEDAVKDALESTSAPTGDPDIRYVAGDSPLDSARRLFRKAGEGAGLVIDPVNPLERTNVNRYRDFLNDLSNHLTNTGGLGVLHCLEGSNEEARTITEHMADVVFRLYVDRAGREIDTQLGVLKYRGGVAPDEMIKLNLEERVEIDTSRDIA
ncbi:MAG: RAD55 family ATPase [Halobacteriaceae archaeon]